jgi:uncharacterized membrane protein YqaE (UPF0057 family)
LAGLPVDLWAWARGWDLMDPAYLALSLAWWPVDVLGRLMALRLLMGPQATADPWRQLPSALSAEIRVGLWMTALFLAGLVPAVGLFSIQGIQSRGWIGAELGLGLLGLIPGLVYALTRLLAPLFVLQGHRAAAALQASTLSLRGHLRPFLRAFLPWMLAGWAVEGLGWLLPDPWGLALTPLATALELNALLRGSSAL